VLQFRAAEGRNDGSLPTGTKEQKAAHRKWVRDVDDATNRARAVIDAPALTLGGMLMKIHVAGFNFNHNV
jgi:hypothetical protein